jgi:hypothetical protein
MSDIDDISNPTSSIDQPDSDAGPFLATVVGNNDPTMMGIIEVQLIRPGGGTRGEGEVLQARYLSPFYGVTDVVYAKADPNSYGNTQKSYGMWMVPPDPGTTVMVIKVQGNAKGLFWIGCVMDDNMNFMTPGLAAFRTVSDLDDATYSAGTALPVAEYNKVVNDTKTITDTEKLPKPTHTYFTSALAGQGLIKDDIRGTTTSSARRESPSMVFGISTPGPLDRTLNYPRGAVGKKEHEIPDYPVSRLGGTTFVMDDGDDSFLRTGSPSDTAIEYVNVEDGGSGGDVKIPHNELVRIRTRTGHQILLHNSEDLIYIGNARGTAWVELTSNGKIDIYAADSISIHTENDLNLYANRDINFEAGRNFNVKAAGKHQLEVGGDHSVIVGGNQKIKVSGTGDITISGTTKLSVSGDFNLKTGGANKFTAGSTTDILSGSGIKVTGSRIDLNGPSAASAAPAKAPTALSTHANLGGKTSIMQRIPGHEPWSGHENLDPTKFTTDKTDRDAKADISAPKAYATPSTATDTFAKVSKGKPTP